MRRSALCLLSGLLLTIPLSVLPASAAAVYGPELQGFTYPHPVQHFSFTSQGQALQMAYMDVAAKGQPNGRIVVLMHGKKPPRSAAILRRPRSRPESVATPCSARRSSSAFRRGA